MSVPVAVLAIVLLMITPVPTFVLDLLISANITLSIIVLLVAISITRAVEFSVFPTALLLLTLFRLALNVSSSRAILLNGDKGTAAAGSVIEAFGSFVAGGNYVVGIVIFLVLIAIQYVVINHGAVRIAEVTARFTLDAMPGKQMSIDSDLNAGLIDEGEARSRRREISLEAEFYGAMDGASRFTQRDAVASILITVINIAAGFAIGVWQHGMDLATALRTYTVLTIGDGLVTVMPALMVSVTGGLIVTRTGTDIRLGQQIRRQLFSDAQPLLVASGVLAALAAFPGLPSVPFLLIGGGLGVAAWRLRSTRHAPAPDAAAPKTPILETFDADLRVDLLSLDLGLGLVKHVEGGAASPLLRRINGVRKQLAGELGFVLPPVRVTDNLSLPAREYVMAIKGVAVARVELPPGCELAIHSRAGSPPEPIPFDGGATREPAFGIPAWWVPTEQADLARAAGFTVVDAVNVIGTHLVEVVRGHAGELFSRQEAKKLLDRVSADNPKLVEDLVPKLLPLSTVHRVLQNLLRERVSIRDGATILEALGEAAILTRNPVLLTEQVRQALGRSIVRPHLTGAGELHALFLDPDLEQAIESGVEHGEHSSQLHLPPQRLRDFTDRLLRKLPNPSDPAIVVASTGARHFIRQIAETAARNLTVIAHGEIPPGTRVVSLGLIQ